MGRELKMNERRTHGGTCARSEESSLTEIAVGKAEGLAYRLQVHIEVPGFPRHDRNNGDRFTTPTDVQFDVKIKTGREMVR
jgi:hypothetical protein